MKASIIIPAYNEEAYIAETLEAVLKQNYSDFEVIVVDNNSNDRTAEIVRGFKGVKLVQELNKGTNWARERGRKEARGEIIATLDADCIPPKDWLSKAESILALDQNIAAVSGPYDYYDAGPVLRLSTYLIQKYIYNLTNKILLITRKGGLIVGGNCVIKTEFLNKIGGFDTSFAFYGDDTDTAKRLSRYGKVVFTSTTILKSSSRRFKKQGVIDLTYKYFINFLKVLFARNSLNEGSSLSG